jgi:hypothetical protein
MKHGGRIPRDAGQDKREYIAFILPALRRSCPLVSSGSLFISRAIFRFENSHIAFI